MTNIIEQIRSDLNENADPNVKASAERFFKESVKIYGLKNAAVHKMAKTYFKTIKDREKAYIFDLCKQLWQSGYMEESLIACDWSYFISKLYEPPDFKVFEKWVNKYINNWASCDTFCNHTIGTFMDMYPEYVQELKKWTQSSNRWVRRASAVSLIIPAKKGWFLADIFEIADLLLLDQDDMVQKGYGWMLKSASQAHQKSVFEYVMEKKAHMPRTALRYAIEKMPENLKEQAMTKETHLSIPEKPSNAFLNHL
ncbi:DNA alkylation repair protein [Thermoproteota archaeon]